MLKRMLRQVLVAAIVAVVVAAAVGPAAAPVALLFEPSSYSADLGVLVEVRLRGLGQ